jgi:hypothetical protein
MHFLLRGVCLLSFLVHSLTAGDAALSFNKQVLPILEKRCAECHGPQKQKAKLDLTAAKTAQQLFAHPNQWFRVLEQIESGEMPPKDETQLTAQERKIIATWVRGDVTLALQEQARLNGRSQLRRFTRNEYANTIDDLFGIRPMVESYLPNDGRVDGYDKVATALPLSADGAYGYFLMADELMKKWILQPPRKGDEQRVVRAKAMESGQSPGHTLVLDEGFMVSFNSDVNSGRMDFHNTRLPGKHHVRFSVYGYQTDKPMPFGLYAGNTWAYPQILELITVLVAPPGKAAVVETDVMLKAGVGLRVIPLGIGVQVPKNHQASKCKGPGLALQWMEIEGPQLPLRGESWLTADMSPELIDELRKNQLLSFGKNDKNAPKSVTRDQFLSIMQSTIPRVAARLFRRELTRAELKEALNQVVERVNAGDRLKAIFHDQIIELLTAPDFLCVIEEPGKLSDYALASRLSYFLWNSTPDEELLAVAKSGRLQDASVLRTQTERLLNDPRSQRFSRDFIDQWLGLRGIDDTTPDAHLYPGYDDFVKYSSLEETYGSFQRMLNEDLSVNYLVAAPWVLVNDKLAEIYGINQVDGPEMRYVPVPKESPYGGLWTQSAVMKITANGTNTSPIKRGVWVAERLLGLAIPPPPADVPAVEPDIRGATTLREQLALHSHNGSCAACQAKFDP